MTIKTWQAVAVAIAATLTIAAAIGFKTPGASAAATERRVDAVELDVKAIVTRVAAHDVDLAGMKKDVDFAARALDALLQKEGLAPSPRRRGSR